MWNTKLKWVLLLLIVAWYFNDPAVPNFSEPWKVRCLQIGSRFVFTVLSIPDSLGLLTLEEAGRLIPLGQPDVPEHIVVRTEKLDGVDVRLYTPKSKSEDDNGYPAYVYYHGGGWTTGKPIYSDGLMFEIVKEMHIVIISVDYRLAPEFPFPIPFDDCVKATKYFLSNAQSFGADPRRVAIGGDSAGGNLAAAVSLKLRDDDFSPMPKIQILIYPTLQSMDLSLPSFIQNMYGPILTSQMMARFLSLYAGGSTKYTSEILRNDHTPLTVKEINYKTHISHENIPKQHQYQPYAKPTLHEGSAETWAQLKDVLENPYFAPLTALDVSNTPEAYVYTAQYDVLRDDGLLYVKRLREAGVPVTHVHGATALHSVCSLHFWLKEGQECLDELITFLKKHL